MIAAYKRNHVANQFWNLESWINISDTKYLQCKENVELSVGI